jgi:hypothetical protein
MLFPGMGGLNENCVLNVKNRSHQVTAEIVVPAGGAEGVLIDQGGITGGWSLYLKDGAPTYTYSFCGQELSTAAALAPGEHQVRMEFAYDGGGPGKGGTATLYVDGERVADTRVGRTHISLFTFDETTDVGRDSGSPVTSDYPALDNGFTGAIKWIRIDLGDDSHDHLISRRRTSPSR